MRTSWTKLTGLVLFAAAVAYGCSSDSKPNPVSEAGTCGNGAVDTGEDCDGTKLNNKNCQSAMMGTYTGGNLKCSSSCRFDFSACTKAMTGTGGRPGTGGMGAGGMGAGGAPAGGAGGKGTGGTKPDAGSDASSGGSGGTTSTDAGKTDAGDAKAPPTL
jgi:hypothetical protein